MPMPVIQTSLAPADFCSVMRYRLQWEADSLAFASMCTRRAGSGKGVRPKINSALHFSSLPTRPLTFVTAKPEPSCSSFASIVSN